MYIVKIVHSYIDIYNHNGNFDTAVQLANSDKVYYRKSIPGKNYTLKSEHLGLRQSNLSDLIDYIRIID